MKPLNLPKESQEALLNGGSMFIVPITDRQLEMYKNYLISKQITNTEPINIEHSSIAPYQIDDEVFITEDGIMLMSNPPQPKVIYKATIKDIKVVRVQDIDYTDKLGFSELDVTRFGYVGNWYNKQYNNYEDNPYVFLYEIERSDNV